MNAHTSFAPIVLGDRQEQFCQQILMGKPANEAYRIAYDAKSTTAEANSSRLMANAKVKARIAQLRAHEAAAAKIDLRFLTTGLLRAYDLGLQTAQSSAASQAMMGIAKLHGFLIERHQVDAIVRRPSASPESPDEMSEAKWLADYGPILEVTANAEPSSIDHGSDTYESLFGSKPTVVPSTDEE